MATQQDPQPRTDANGKLRRRFGLASLPDWARRWTVKHYGQVIGLISIAALIVISGASPGRGASALPILPGIIALLIAVLIGVIIAATPRQKYTTFFARHFGWLPVAAAALSYPFWYWRSEQMTGGGPDTDFFSVAAQVLPVLLLAAIIDVRRSAYLKSYQLILPIAAVYLGETSALNVLAFFNKNSEAPASAGDFATVSASLVCATLALVLAVLADLGENDT
jgi:hypothetical protein